MPDDDDDTHHDPPKTTAAQLLSGWPLIAALVVVAAWLGALGFLLFQAGTTEVHWSRLLIVLSSVEAVAFAAAGALFGTTIQRERVEQSQRQAVEANQKAKANEQAAVNGRILAEIVKRESSEVDHIRPSDDPPESLGDLARRLFPD